MTQYKRCRRQAIGFILVPNWLMMTIVSLTIFGNIEVQAFSRCGASKFSNPALDPSRGRSDVVPQRRIFAFQLNGKSDDDDKDDPNITNVNNKPIGKEEEEFFLVQRFQKADFLEIRRDAVLVTCFVLSRFLVYDILTSTKATPGWVIQDVVWLTGTFSSAVVLVVYWTIAGLLSRTFETTRPYGPVQVLVNVALCCPIWLATEHLFGFGPANIGGETLAQAIATGFLGLASFMALSRALTTDWER